MSDSSNHTVNLQTVRRAFADGEHPPTATAPDELRAGVAMILAGAEDALRICMIRRAEEENDPWSGHMAFPGGKEDPEDAGPQAAAQREAMEEVGVPLRDAQLIAPLNRVPAYARGKRVGLMLFPYLYYLGQEPARLVPNDEVGAAFWIPLAHLLAPDNATTLEMQRNGEMLTFPGIRYGESVIWGLSYRILSQFAERVGNPLPASVPYP